MKKIFILTMAVITMLGIAGCKSAESSKAESDSVKEVSCKEILDGILLEVTDTNNDTRMYYEDDKYEDYFEYLYDTSYKRIDDGAFAYASSAYADEITVLHAEEAEDVDTLTKHLEDRIERRMSDFNGYKPEEVDKLQNAVIETSGEYVLMVVSDKPEEVVEAFKKIIEQKGE